mmetsp:Transcript_20070/g.42432  ORF Transcript_20070/g.42432 Transcript_20070/m.42432 type:complete len:490 (-) Transcript_20070:1420-2889(-)
MGELKQLAKLIESGKAKNILVLCGAGVSTGAGIPDFRSPGTGLYDNLQKYGLPYPEAIFEINYYRRKPDAFVSLARELWPGIKYKPTLTHHFIKVLADKGLLLRIYSQNIDGLEFLAEIPEDKLVECHGHFRTASCIDCHKPADAEKVKSAIVDRGVTPKCSYCGGSVKPDIVFFGEGLPNRFHKLLKRDMPKADLLLVMGTSLQVAPVSMIPDMVRCNRVLFNRDLVMKIRKKRDLFVPGDCDSNVQTLLDLLGWTVDDLTSRTEKEELETMFDQIKITDIENDQNNEHDNDDKGAAVLVPAEDTDSDNDFAPTTVVVMLGSINFEPVHTADILSIKIQTPEERSKTLEKASKNIRPNSLESMHVLLKSSSLSSLFDESIFAMFYEGIIPGKEVTVHVLPKSAVLTEDMAVQSDDVESVRMGLVTAGLVLKVEEANEGSWVLTAIKPGGTSDEEDEEEQNGDEDSFELKEEEAFRNLVNKELEKSKNE